ncbi:MAG: IPT/TIG domain-containing protein [Myxococcota bacterium]
MDASVVERDAGTADAAAELPDASTELADAAVELPDASTELPDAGTDAGITMDASVVERDAGTADAAAELPDASTELADAAVELPDASTELPDAGTAGVDLMLSTLAATPTELVADGVQSSVLTVTVRNADGEPMAGETVRFSANAAEVMLAQPAMVTDAGGVATGLARSETPGTVTVSAQVGEAVLQQTVTITFIHAPPIITSVEPIRAGVGAAVTIRGTRLTGASVVSFGGTSQPSFMVLSDGEILTGVPMDAQSGVITVTTPGGTATSEPFAVIPLPTMTGFVPSGGTGVGMPVTILGTALDDTISVHFGGTQQPVFTVDSSTQISTTVPAGAESGPVMVVTPGGTAMLDFTVIPSPVITAVLPAGGAGVGLAVTIQGASLDDATRVEFNGVEQPDFSVDSSTQISTTVPAGAQSGPLTVTTPGGSASTAFTVIPAPTITSFSPSGGAGIGLPVIIEGTHFTGATLVRFNMTEQPAFTVDSATRISTTVPAGATTGPIEVVTPGGTATSTSFTVVPAPTITGMAPGSATEGSLVTLDGTALGNASSVRFGGNVEATFMVVNDTRVTSVVPVGAASGPITVTTPGGSAASQRFTVLPSISSFSPRRAATGATLIIDGTSFSGATEVRFGGTLAQSFTVQSPTRISAVVGAGSSGPVSVTTPDGTATTSGLLAPGVELASGSTRDVVGSDLNADGWADAIYTLSNNIAVRLSNGDGSYGPEVRYAVGENPYSIAVGRLAGDNFPDVVVSNLSSGTVSVLKGTATGALQARVDYACGAGPRRIRLGHLDGDGRLDLVVAQSTDPNISILRGAAGGAFAAYTTVFAGYNSAGNVDWVETGDINEDGRLDVVTLDYGGGSALFHLLGNGNATVQAPVYLGTWSRFTFTLVDVNGDGILDLLDNGGSSDVSVRLGNGTGGFTLRQTVGRPAYPFRQVAGDVTGDGSVDLVLNDQLSPDVIVCVGRGDGTFQQPCFTQRNNVHGSYHGLNLADTDGDGVRDILYATTGGVYSVRSTPQGFFTFVD